MPPKWCPWTKVVPELAASPKRGWLTSEVACGKELDSATTDGPLCGEGVTFAKGAFVPAMVHVPRCCVRVVVDGWQVVALQLAPQRLTARGFVCLQAGDAGADYVTGARPPCPVFVKWRCTCRLAMNALKRSSACITPPSGGSRERGDLRKAESIAHVYPRRGSGHPSEIDYIGMSWQAT